MDIPFEFDLSCGAGNDFDISAAVLATGINFSSYATKAYVDSVISGGSGSSIGAIYASNIINDAGFLTEHQSLSNYYSKSEVDSLVSGASQTITVTQTLTSGTEIGSVNGTKLYAPTATAATDLSNYYTKSQVDEAFVKSSQVIANISSGTRIATIAGVSIFAPVTSGGSVDLSNYYTKLEADTLFAKKSEITPGSGSAAICVFG